MIEDRRILNIKDLALNLPARKDSFSFDPKKDLSSSQLIRYGIDMEEDARNLDNRLFSNNFPLVQRTMFYHILLPDKQKSLINDTRWTNMKNTLSDTMQGENVADTLAIMKLTAPERMANGITVSNSSWNEMIRRYDEQVQVPLQAEGMYGAIRMARAFGIWTRDDQFQISEETLDKMYDSVVTLGPKMGKRDAITMLADFRIVDETRFKKYKKEHPRDFEDYWNFLKDKLQDDEVNITAVGALSILGADSIQIEDGVIKLINNEAEIKETTNPIPGRRKF